MIGYLQVQRVVDACGINDLDGAAEFDSDLPGFEAICSVCQFCFVRLAKVWSNFSKVVRIYGLWLGVLCRWYCELAWRVG